ncbi:MAG: thioredoxin family protein [Bdellovibrionota bacterium]|nr:thioredoxin family protein [Bdellovibrionota bacterium]
MKQKIFFLLNLLFFSTFSFAQFKVQSTKKLDPVSFSATVFTHNKEKFLSLTYQNKPKWHTNWKNPGDAGIPLSFEFLSSGKKIKLTSLEWPIPQRFYEKGNLLAYGYIDRYSFFFPFSKHLKELEGKELEVTSKWLVCKEICIPGKKTFKSIITNGQLDNKTNISQEELETAFKSLPKKAAFPLGLGLELHKKEGAEELFLSYQLKNKDLADLPEKRNILTPFPQAPFDFHKEKAINGQIVNANMRVQWDGEYLEPALPFPKKNTFKKPYLLKFLYTDLKGNVSIIEKSFKGFLSKTKAPKKINLIKPVPLSAQTKNEITLPVKKTVPKKSFLAYFFFAFLGGLILNFMPCVFPVISLKLFSLLKQKSMDRVSILKHNAIYSGGILFSFLILSLVVLLLKTSGEQIGWGFHLQSPTFVAIMIIVLFVLSLNLFGLFEIKTPGGKLVGNIETDQSYKGDFISGILATILSTPCSAPFLGVALTFAFTSPFHYTLIIFLSVGLGLSFPFLMVGLVPALLKALPRPGAWMEQFKKVLGLSLLLTGLWLFDVFQNIISHFMSSTLLILTLILIFFSFYSFKNMGPKNFVKAVLLGVPLGTFLYLIFFKLQDIKTVPSTKMVREATPGLWEKWAPQKMDDYQKQGQSVFVDFTAKWCFTCIVNKKLVLQTKDFENLIKEKKVKALRADWTKRDPIIGNWLKTQGVFGLPAYFIQTPTGKLINLGETISIGEIRDNLKNLNNF